MRVYTLVLEQFRHKHPLTSLFPPRISVTHFASPGRRWCLWTPLWSRVNYKSFTSTQFLPWDHYFSSDLTM